MTRVLAAIDNSPAAKPVLAAARAIADLLGAEVDCVHVRVNGETTARSAAETVGTPLRLLVGETVDALLRAGEETDVAALVVGARALPTSPRPLGSTATAVATTLSKPVVVVPPEAGESAVRRILVPLEGSRSTSEAPESLIEAALQRDREVVVLHVIGVDSIPAFTDQPQHDLAAWTEEFLARYCPASAGAVSFETRVGRAEALVPLAAARADADLVAFGWSQDFAAGRAAVVRATLERSRVPVMLVPVHAAAGDDARTPAEELQLA